MSNSDFVCTTFTFKRDHQWLFKHIVHVKDKKMRDVTSKLTENYIEDYQDELQLPYYKNLIEKLSDSDYSEWLDFKRRMKLDEA